MKRELYLEKRRAKTAAKDLKYSNEVLDKIDAAKSVEEIIEKVKEEIQHHNYGAFCYIGSCFTENHSVAEPGEVSALLTAEVQRQHPRDAHGTADHLAGGHAVALEEDAGQDDHREDTHRVEDGSPCPLAVRETEVEETIVECRVEQGEDEQEEPVAALPYGKGAVGRCRHGEDDESRAHEAEAGKEHLAARHLLGDFEFLESNLDKRIGPSPEDGGGECEGGDPGRAHKDGRVCLFHVCLRKSAKLVNISHISKHFPKHFLQKSRLGLLMASRPRLTPSIPILSILIG